MAVVVRLLLMGLVQIAGPLITRWLLTLGIGAVTYSGFNVAMDFLKTQFMSSANTLPSEVLGLLGVLKVGTSFNILMAAVVMKLTMSGVSNTVSRFKVK